MVRYAEHCQTQPWLPPGSALPPSLSPLPRKGIYNWGPFTLSDKKPSLCVGGFPSTPNGTRCVDWYKWYPYLLVKALLHKLCQPIQIWT